MADSPEATDSLAIREREGPAPDPIVSRSTSAIMLICALLLTGSLAWALYDETYGQRPWKSVQREFVARYKRYLKSIRSRAGTSEAEIKSTPEYQALDEQAKAAREKVQSEVSSIDAQVTKIQDQLNAVTDPFQNQRGRLLVINYYIETAKNDSAKRKYSQQAQQKRQEVVPVELPAEDGTGKTRIERMNYDQLDALFNELRDRKEDTDFLRRWKERLPSEVVQSGRPINLS